MSQMTQTLTSTPPTDDLVVPFHCDRCGALAKVRVVLASGSDLVILPFDAALKEIAERAGRGIRLENWEGWVHFRGGMRAKSLNVSGSFALSRDPARAAATATDAIQQAHARWQRDPEYQGAELLFGLTFGEP